jgi:hypothetical protein
VSRRLAADHPIYVDVINGKADRSEDKTWERAHVVRLIWDTRRTPPTSRSRLP